jgi:hypothetical protein
MFLTDTVALLKATYKRKLLFKNTWQLLNTNVSWVLKRDVGIWRKCRNNAEIMQKQWNESFYDSGSTTTNKNWNVLLAWNADSVWRFGAYPKISFILAKVSQVCSPLPETNTVEASRRHFRKFGICAWQRQTIDFYSQTAYNTEEGVVRKSMPEDSQISAYPNFALLWCVDARFNLSGGIIAIGTHR